MNMGFFLSYSIVSGLLMLAMYLAYHLFLSRENQHSFNRGVLLSIYVISFAVPLVLTALDRMAMPSADDVLAMEIGAAGGEATAGEASSSPLWAKALIWIFMAGIAVVSVKSVITVIRLVRVVRGGKKYDRGAYTLVVTTDERYAPFSWMRYMVVTDSDFANNCAAIATHELRHIAARHWIDLLIAQVVCIVNWFNPAAWLMRDELMLVHEYQADMAVIDHGHDPREYQMLLIKKAVGARFPSLANSLNHSKLKKRITMMYKEKSGAGSKLKTLALVPVLALALGVAAVPAVRAAVSTIGNSSVSDGKVSEKLPNDSVITQHYQVGSITSDGSSTTVVIKGSNMGNSVNINGGTCTNNGKTYHANSLNFNLSDGTGTIKVTYPFAEELKDAKMALNFNGIDVSFNLDKVPKTVVKSVTTLSINGNDQGLKNTKILLDGKEISSEEMAQLNPETIVGITVNRQKETIEITTK